MMRLSRLGSRVFSVLWICEVFFEGTLTCYLKGKLRPTDDDQIHLWFDNYQKPEGAIEVEAQKLNPSYVQSLKDSMVTDS